MYPQFENLGAGLLTSTVASSSRLDKMPGHLRAEGNLLPGGSGFCTNVGKGRSGPEGNQEEMLMNERTTRVEIIQIWMLRKIVLWVCRGL